MTTLLPVLLAAFVALPGTARAFDAKALEDHIRESYNLPDDVRVDFGPAKASEVEGFNLLDVRMSRGPVTKEEKLYLSKDGRYYVLGGFRDVQFHPDQDRIKKVDLKGAAARGNAKAPVTVVEYTDFQCPYCQKGYEIMRSQVMKEYEGKVRWFYKSLPLAAIHPWAQDAAVAVECARLQNADKFWKLHDVIFDRQREITRGNADEKLLLLAKTISLDEGPFKACYDDRKTLDTVQRDMAEAELMGINGTPAFLVNGHLVSGADYGGIKQAVEESLKGKHGKH